MEAHRQAVIKAVNAHNLKDVAMENDSSKLVDIIESSLHMVRDGAAYIGIIGKKYGQTPKSPERNPGNLSITELEFNEAISLRRPILLFIMGKDHMVHEDDIETNAKKKKMLDAFRERAKKMPEDPGVDRVYSVFNSLEEFREKVGISLAELSNHLNQKASAASMNRDDEAAMEPAKSRSSVPIPKPPALYAYPAYIGSHQFIGRKAQLEELDDWALEADPNPILLFEAIGGNGKSMLTWEWTTNHAKAARSGWAGCFWYSFYEKGAYMADFCSRALSYMTGRAIEEFNRKKTTELAEILLYQLREKPWLLILDGLERILVAYHRIDAAELPDEAANKPTDIIAHRDPCAAIRPEDDDLLRALTTARPSKILVTSRLIPRGLLNKAGQPIPGVQRVSLPGLRPADAEGLIRSCGITGDSAAIQNYLKSHCDCHPLVIGIIAGLINDYLPDIGNFDTWVMDDSGGGKLNLANLDLVQKRNHILSVALNALSEKSLQLLSTISLISEAVDYQTLVELNPHLPPEIPVPTLPAGEPESEKENSEKSSEYKKLVELRQQSSEFLAAPGHLAISIRDLENRGLLQYDHMAKRYDLHPVVRGITTGRLIPDETNRIGQKVVDHFSAKAHRPYEEAETLEDMQDGLRVFRTLLKMGQFEAAQDMFGDFIIPLLNHLEAYNEILELIRPFSPNGWTDSASKLSLGDKFSTPALASFAHSRIGNIEEALNILKFLVEHIHLQNDSNMLPLITLMAKVWGRMNHLALENYCYECAVKIKDIRDVDNKSILIVVYLDRLLHLWTVANRYEAENIERIVEKINQDYEDDDVYTKAYCKFCNIQVRFWRGDVSVDQLIEVEQLARSTKDRNTLRLLNGLRGHWLLEHGKPEESIDSLEQAVKMAREVGIRYETAEILLALARIRMGLISDPVNEAEQVSTSKKSESGLLAELWLEVGDLSKAKQYALAAYHWAWADGEPFVRRYELNKAKVLLERLGQEIPQLPPYDETKVKKQPWQYSIEAAIEKLRKEANENSSEPESV